MSKEPKQGTRARRALTSGGKLQVLVAGVRGSQGGTAGAEVGKIGARAAHAAPHQVAA